MYRELAKCICALSIGIEKSSSPEDRKLVSDYLAALPPLLARAVLGEDILKDLTTIERLFGNTGLIEPEAFEQGLENWGEFREEYGDFAMNGMIVSEGLSALDLLHEFDVACENQDRERRRSILERIRRDSESIERIIDEKLGNS